MDWWKRKKSRANEKNPRLIRGREKGAMLLEDLIECCDGKSNPVKIFSADQILEATNNVCKCNIPRQNPTVCECTLVSELSKYGGWYSGTLDNQRMILLVPILWRTEHYTTRPYIIWRTEHSNPQGFCPVVRDIAISSMVSGHKNFMKLVGCCLETEIPFVVYYGEKKQYYRIDLKTVVSWRKRMKIAHDIATALAYLHTAFSRPFVYSNMDLWNILLDEDGVAKLCDFSNCVSIPLGETFVKLGSVRAGFDYVDDAFIATGVVSEKTDAFGFGILMQKLFTGEERFRQLRDSKSISNRNSRSLSLSESVGERRIDECVDPKMLEKMGQVSKDERRRMEAFLLLSERCIGLRGEVPKMVQVAKELKRLLKDFSSSFSPGETETCSVLEISESKGRKLE